MIEDIILKSKSNSFNQIVIKDNDDYKNLVIRLRGCLVPFGLEEYNGKYVLNFEIDNEFNELMSKLESEIDNLLENKFILKSVFNKRDGYNVLCKGHIKKSKNTIITKYIKDKREVSIFDLEKGKKYNLELEVSGIWIYKSNAGYYLNIINIRE